jgi:hypothetical protein
MRRVELPPLRRGLELALYHSLWQAAKPELTHDFF